MKAKTTVPTKPAAAWLHKPKSPPALCTTSAQMSALPSTPTPNHGNAPFYALTDCIEYLRNAWQR